MALVPPFYLDCVVAIGFQMGDEVQYGATGFLLGNLRDDASIGKEKHYRVYLATNRHVLEGKTSGLLRFNTFGFPMGQVGKERNYTIVRHGSLARVRDAIVGSSESFLVDTLIFPHGGPVVISWQQWRPRCHPPGGSRGWRNKRCSAPGFLDT